MTLRTKRSITYKNVRKQAKSGKCVSSNPKYLYRIAKRLKAVRSN